MRKLRCESVEEVGTKFGVERTAALPNDLVAASTRVEEVRYADIKADGLRRIITETSGGQGTCVFK